LEEVRGSRVEWVKCVKPNGRTSAEGFD
jgi:hypothetical protein